jgi:hypothetical protein
VNIFQLIRCSLGKHHRDKRRALRDEDDVPRSKCTGCGRPMVKAKGGWRLG